VANDESHPDLHTKHIVGGDVDIHSRWWLKKYSNHTTPYQTQTVMLARVVVWTKSMYGVERLIDPPIRTRDLVV
jgi:hypothetical protein